MRRAVRNSDVVHFPIPENMKFIPKNAGLQGTLLNRDPVPPETHGKFSTISRFLYMKSIKIFEVCKSPLHYKFLMVSYLFDTMKTSWLYGAIGCFPG